MTCCRAMARCCCTRVQVSKRGLNERNLPITMRHLRFFKFIMDEIFPGARLPTVALVEEHSTKVGFTVSRIQRLQPHYARTLDMWAAAPGQPLPRAGHRPGAGTAGAAVRPSVQDGQSTRARIEGAEGAAEPR